MTELDPLISTVNFENYQTTKPPSKINNNTMHQNNSDNNLRGLPHTAAIATNGSRRQLFYRDRIPSHSMTSNSQDYTNTHLHQNSPIVTTIDSTDSESEYNNNNNYIDEGLPPQPQGLPPPRELHENYSHRLHRNSLAQGHQNFVVGGVHGRYRDYGGTLIEVPEEVYAVRKAALTVLDPITYCWLILTIGFSTSVALGAAKWTNKLGSLPYWAIFLPAWLSHLGIIIIHVLSARALSKFISEANENRQRQDSTDHLDRVEYLPLLQRSLKFGLKTGVLCFITFIFEVLLYIRLIQIQLPWRKHTSHCG